MGQVEGGVSSARTLHRVLSHEFDHACVLVEDGGVQLQTVVAHLVRLRLRLRLGVRLGA